ncbi:hypothetical protein [Nitrosococcus watsonii]|uniref:Uncharacterized protein n=1 Tax=Nitrosococcus watsoni (strain C-113) TaxID=105559 RepID=D8K6J4_NITWC|nr:hypothetical protein [Nitrosococcus watsonii]ADJ28521.1 conserved hypothetical protein [Nitrosococcus watsonii C-113]
MDDTDLIDGVARANSEALGQLYDRYAPSFQAVSEQAVITAVVCFGIAFIKPPERER